MDMAVGVIIGAAFSKIVSSLVTDIIMPPIGKIVGNIDFSNLFINLSDKPVATLAEATKMKVPVIAYGLFLTNIIYFLIIAFVIFILVIQLNKLKKEEVPEADRLCPYCKSEIAKDATRCPHCTSQLKD
ncbi:MAG: large conductance mechanosensitive channel protein MscL [Acholeplasmataceae bacterium]|nr:large conductance mechanosensitive channel protein MscL [Acholeplasmataceae bacterium]